MPYLIPFLTAAMFFENMADSTTAQKYSHVPDRSEIPEQYHWNLADIYTNDELWQADFKKLKASLPTQEQYKGKLTDSAQNLLACLKARDEIGITSSKLYAFARMHRDENTSIDKYQSLTGKVEALLADAGAATSFIEPEIIAMPEKTLTKFRQEESGLSTYDFYFENLARQKSHVLSPAEEEILSRASEVTQASENIFNMLAHADMKFPQIMDEEGNCVQLSEGRYSIFIRSSDRKVRQQAFTHLFATYNQYRNTFAATLGGSVKKDIFYAKLRKYNSTLESELEGDNIPTEVYDNLITTVHNNLAPLHRYVALKKKAL
ncbi:MAG TPA: M3 family metallopeptidase, partial [Negativicutes bacterium]